MTMISRRGILATLLAVALGVASGTNAGAAKADDFSGEAQSFIVDLGDRVIEELTPKGLKRAERETRFRSILNDHFAVDAIGQWVLGRYWRKANKAQREQYLELFENLIIATYVNRFENYKGQTFSVQKAVMKGGKDAIVSSRINQTDGSPPVKVDWRVKRTKSGSYKIVDVIVEGISMGQTQRSEFASVIRENGGSIDAFLDRLRERVENAA